MKTKTLMVIGLILLISLVITGCKNGITGSAVAVDDLVEMQNGYQIIRMDVTKQGWSPNQFLLKKDVPVKWIITGKEITGCNNAIQVPALDLNFDIKPGEQVIEFTPKKEGTITWSCWMDMLPGKFIVKENIDTNSAKAIQQATVTQQGSCDSCGSSTCGGSCGVSSCGAAQGGCSCGGK